MNISDEDAFDITLILYYFNQSLTTGHCFPLKPFLVDDIKLILTIQYITLIVYRIIRQFSMDNSEDSLRCLIIQQSFNVLFLRSDDKKSNSEAKTNCSDNKINCILLLGFLESISLKNKQYIIKDVVVCIKDLL